MKSRSNAIIDLAAIQHNFNIVRTYSGKQQIIAMIKADAYGHGLIKVANALTGADSFGVACTQEAWQLRQAGISHPIVLFSGFVHRDELEFLIAHDISTVIHHPAQVELLEKMNWESPYTVWLKIDTGMHRLGISTDEYPNIVSRLKKLPMITFKVMTHLADADNLNTKQYTLNQIQTFSELTRDVTGDKSIANSAGILAFTEYLFDVVRPGIMLYGVSPFSEKHGLIFNLKPAMTLSSKIIAIKQLKRGDKIGYGCTWECPEDMPVAVIGIGYGDGYPRHAVSGTPVLINKIRCPLVGRVSMDMLSVDLRGQPNAQIGDEVTLWGSGLPIEEIARYSNTIGYELLCHLTSRVDYLYTH